MPAGVAVGNGDLERRTLRNSDSVAINRRLFVCFNNIVDAGFVNMAHANAGEVAGLIEDVGRDMSNPGVSDMVAATNTPVGQLARIRYRGTGQARAVALACRAGTKAYVVKTGGDAGRVTNTSNSGANPLVGVFESSTTGTLDELVLVNIDLM